MALLDDVKSALRITTDAFDGEVGDLIAAAQADLQLSGVTTEQAQATDDALIRRAVITYAKAHFGWDNPDSERLARAYDMLKSHLTLSREYGMYAVTFTVTDGASPLEDASVAFAGENMDTDASGKAVFWTRAAQNIAYTVTLDGYQTATGEVDVTGTTTVTVALEAV